MSQVACQGGSTNMKTHQEFLDSVGYAVSKFCASDWSFPCATAHAVLFEEEPSVERWTCLHLIQSVSE